MIGFVCRYDLPWIGDITLAISICFLYAGYWVVLYIYYKSLPDLRLIGKLMNLKSVFIERPQCKYCLESVCGGGSPVKAWNRS